MTKDELIEALAHYEHASWARWMSYFLGKCKQVPFEGTNNANLFVQRDLIISAAYVEALQKQIDTPYTELPEHEKRYDRDEVAHILPIIEEYAASHDSLARANALLERIEHLERKVRILDTEVFSTHIGIFGKGDNPNKDRQTLLGRVDTLSGMAALGPVDQSFFLE